MRWSRLYKGLWRHKTGSMAVLGVVSVTSFKRWQNRTTYVQNDSAAMRHWSEESKQSIELSSIKPRLQQIEQMWKHDSPNDELDVLVIGGGATGCGVALDACTRGLSVALVEKNDFGSGTSGRSTKLIHGGVRYLEKAVLNLDRSQWDLVTEAIGERAHLINITPHLSWPLPIIIPVYDELWLRGVYKLCRYYIGCKLYEGMAGRNGMLSPSYLLSAAHSRLSFPQIRAKDLIGSVVYYDGQHNDARMNVSIALTAASKGALVANHVELVDLIRDPSPGKTQRVIGARLRDTLSGFEWNTYAKVVVNATGAFVDKVRKMDDYYASPLIRPSRGSHAVLPGTFCAEKTGLLVPKTKDGRVVFMLPFEGIALCGTTDKSMDHEVVLDQDTKDICSSTEEVDEILSEINHYLHSPADLSDVDAAWAGIRPLACIPEEHEQFVGGFPDAAALNRARGRSAKRDDDDGKGGGVGGGSGSGIGSGVGSSDGSRNGGGSNHHMCAQLCIPSLSREERRNRVWNRQRGEHTELMKSMFGTNAVMSDEISKAQSKVNTANISRQHLIEVNPDSGLVTVTGGKWTTYRQMSEDVVNLVCELHPDLGMRAAECVSTVVKLLGSQNWTSSVTAILERHQIPKDIAEYLSRNYGDKAFVVGDIYLKKQFGKRLAGGYPQTEAEVIYCCRHEMAETATDVLSNRTRLALLSRAAAEYALPRVIQIMGDVHSWDTRTRVSQYHETCDFLRTMHVKDRHKWGRSRHTVNYARRVVETVLNGPSMTDEAIEFVIERFMDFYNDNNAPLQAQSPPPGSNISASARTQLMNGEVPLEYDTLRGEHHIHHHHHHNINGNNGSDDGINDSADSLSVNGTIDYDYGDDDDIMMDESELQYLRDIQNERRLEEVRRKQRKLFEGCISREQARELVSDFAQVFGDDRVIDACMFTGMRQLGLYEILVSCAGCAADPEQFDPEGPWVLP